MQRIGHGGAGAVVRGNTLASFDAALELGVDMIEFDVRACGGRLVLAHTRLHARAPRTPTLDEALAHLAGRRFAGVALDLDVKQPGAEVAILAALERFGLSGRALISSQCVPIVDRVRRLDPAVRTAVSVGGRLSRAVQRWGEWRDAVLDGLQRGRYDAVMLHHRLVGPALVTAVRARGGELFAWTVDDARLIGVLDGMGVHGVVTNDPRLFALPGAMAPARAPGAQGVSPAEASP